MDAMAEQTLARKVSERDPDAMKALYDRYAGYLTAVCSRYIDSKEDINDLMQESFIKIFSGIGSFVFRGEGSLKAWMSRIVSNTAIRHLQQNSRLDMTSLDNVQAITDEEADTSLSELDDIPPEVIQEMIKSLPSGYRAVFNLFVFEDKSHREIADMLGIKENSSASQLHRAKARLAQQIQEYRKMTTR